MKALLFCIAVFGAAPVYSFSCMSHALSETEVALHNLEDVQRSTKPYSVVLGKFKPSRAQPKIGTHSDGWQYMEWKGRFVGQALGKEGFTRRFDRKIRYIYACDVYAGCTNTSASAGLLTDQPVVAFIEHDSRTLVLRTNECRSNVSSATSAVVNSIKNCHINGDCSP
ncbi:hypothetical protein [Halovulum sp. GXIMD14793]